MVKKLLRIVFIAAVFVVAGLMIAGGGLRAEPAVDTSAMEQAIHDYIMKNPEVIIESLNVYQRRGREEATKTALEKHGDYLFGKDHPQGGNKSGNVTMVEFFDYNCGYCKKAMVDMMNLVENDGNIRLLFVEFPILGPSSETAAKMALAAQNQGKYVEFHRALMETTGQLSDGKIEEVAKSVGLDVEKLKADAKDKKTSEALLKNRQIALSMGITGTPAFLINKDLYPGYLQYDELKKAVEEARNPAKEE